MERLIADKTWSRLSREQQERVIEEMIQKVNEIVGQMEEMKRKQDIDYLLG